MNKSAMATDLLSAGIRKFEEDGDKLKTIIREAIAEFFKKEEKQPEPEAEKNE